MDVFITGLNLVAVIATIYCIVTIPGQFIRRYRRKKAGETVSPMRLIIRKLLKYWLYTALVLIPLASLFSFMALSQAGASGAEIAVALITQTIIGNIGTSLIFGYVGMRADKDGWSHSAIEDMELRTLA